MNFYGATEYNREDIDKNNIHFMLVENRTRSESCYINKPSPFSKLDKKHVCPYEQGYLKCQKFNLL